MKNVGAFFFVIASLFAKADDPYRAYLFSKISKPINFRVQESSVPFSTKTTCVIPRFERPKGAVFCRMEDYLTTKTKVWFKVGVH